VAFDDDDDDVQTGALTWRYSLLFDALSFGATFLLLIVTSTGLMADREKERDTR
jgi:hypothetical protein